MNAIIVGCSRVGSELARILSLEGHNVTIIDKNKLSFKRLGQNFNGLTMIGNGIDLETLKKAGIENADAFAVATNGDNTNLMSAQIAKNIFNVPKVIARLYDPRRASLYRQKGLDIISGTTLVAALMRDRLIESLFSGYLIETSSLGTLEVEAPASLVGKKVSRVGLPGKFRIISIVRKDSVILPEAGTYIEQKDKLIGIVKIESLQTVKKMLGIK